MPYEELVKRLRRYVEIERSEHHGAELEAEAADAIEERDRYALTLQHEMIAEAESHIALVERLNKQIEELQKNVAYWQAQLAKSMCGETLAELEKPRWIPVTERLPEEWTNVMTYQPTGPHNGLRRVGVYIGGDKWREAEHHNMMELPVTHWMPLPPAPEPSKEEET